MGYIIAILLVLILWYLTVIEGKIIMTRQDTDMIRRRLNDVCDKLEESEVDDG